MLELFIILGLILLNGIFSMTEMAMVSTRKSKLESQAAKGSKSAKRTLAILAEPNKFLSTIQIGITLIGILTGIFSGETMQKELIRFLLEIGTPKALCSTLSTTIIVIIVTYFTLVLGELVPKRIGLIQPEKIASKMTPFMLFLSKIAFPFIWLLSVSTEFLVKILHLNPSKSKVTEEEIKAMINESTEQGEIEPGEQEIIERVFHLNDRTVSSIMTHYSDLRWLEIKMTINEAKIFALKHPYSIYPLCENDIDHVKGIVRVKDLFSVQDNKRLEDICLSTLFVPENNTIFQVMKTFKDSGIHNCFVVDEYGSIQGLVTRKDIFESIVGDMPENDEKSQLITPRPDGSYWIDGQIHFYDFLDYFDFTANWEEEIEKFDTLAGFAISKLGRIPHVGDRFSWEKFTFEIADMDKQRVDKILVTIK